MPAEGSPSEYGGKVQDNTIQPKGEEALEASEKLRLVYRTGTENPTAPVDNRAWNGDSL